MGRWSYSVCLAVGFGSRHLMAPPLYSYWAAWSPRYASDPQPFSTLTMHVLPRYYLLSSSRKSQGATSTAVGSEPNLKGRSSWFLLLNDMFCEAPNRRIITDMNYFSPAVCKKALTTEATLARNHQNAFLGSSLRCLYDVNYMNTRYLPELWLSSTEVATTLQGERDQKLHPHENVLIPVLCHIILLLDQCFYD